MNLLQKLNLVLCVGTVRSNLYLRMEMGLSPKSGVCKMMCFILTVYKIQLVCVDDDDDEKSIFSKILDYCFSVG